MNQPRIVSRDEWLAVRKAHLAEEKEFTRWRDRAGSRFWGLRSSAAPS
jgi:predicted dithiol-disulfide oxidoreductase (DUF899 family)